MNSAAQPANLGRAKQLLLIALAGVILGFAVSVLFWFTARTASAQADSTFSPIISITVPQTDSDGDNVNDYLGYRFEISYSLAVGSSIPCTESASETHVIREDGSVALEGARVDLLVNDELGQPCQYVVRFPVDVGAIGLHNNGRENIFLTTTYQRNIGVNYVTSRATFTSTTNIIVPQTDVDSNSVNDFSGTRIRVNYENLNTGSGVSGQRARRDCTGSAIEVYVVRDDGSVAIEGSRATLLAFSQNSDDISTTYGNCHYAKKTIYNREGNLVLDRYFTSPLAASKDGVVISYADPGADSLRYVGYSLSEFLPELSGQVLWVDYDANGIHDSAGARIAVDFSPQGNSGGRGCSGETKTTFRVADSGSLVQEGQPARLKRIGDDLDGCRYSYTPTRTIGNDYIVYVEGGVLYNYTPIYNGECISNGIAICSSDSDQVGYTILSYEPWSPTENYVPDIRISVPQVDYDSDGVNDYADTRFEVRFLNLFAEYTFSSYTDNCLAEDAATYIVQDDGTVVLLDSDFRLSRKYIGNPLLFCAYGVFWPRVAGLRLAEQTEYNFVFNALHPVSAVYVPEDIIQFEPVVSLSVPDSDADGDGVSDFAGTRFNVGFSQLSGSFCSGHITKTYVVKDNGEVEALDGEAPVLTDRLPDIATGCVYNVVWPDAAGFALQPGATAKVSAGARTASASYVPVAGSSFSPAVAVSVPQTDADGNGVNDFSGTSFAVGFRRVFGSDGRCTNSANGTYVVQDDGSVSGSDPVLVDRPAGVAAGCVYVVVWPDVAGLERQSGATVTVSALARSASVIYLAGVTYVAPGTAGPGQVEPEPADAEVAEADEVDPEETEPEDTQLPADSANDGSNSGGPVASAPVSGVETLPQGWSVLSFNGPAGMSPADFASALENSINSVWVWDAVGHQWSGWTSGQGSLGLDGLTPGDVVMVYAPVGGVVVYRPAGLLGHPPGVNSWTLAPTAISLVVYGGASSASASDMFASHAISAVAVYLWDARNQQWKYHLPGRQPLSAVQVPWFDTINPGDAMFVYNISPTAVTIPWQ